MTYLRSQNKNSFIKKRKSMAEETPKRLICEFEKPSNVSQLVNYYRNFLTGLAADTLFDPIATLIAEAGTEVTKLNDAELAALTRVPGTVAARDKQLLTTNIKLEQVLSKVQEAGDANLDGARALFEVHQLKIRARSKTEKGEFEATQGKVSKTIDVTHQVIKGRVAYLFVISTDKLKWHLGAFGTASMDTIDNINDEKLTIGTLYYLKSRTRHKGIYSDWSQVLEVTCI
jgi:hypothetical protein